MTEPTTPDERYTAAFDALLARAGDDEVMIDLAFALSRAAGDLIAQRDNEDVALMQFQLDASQDAIDETEARIDTLAGVALLDEVCGILDRPADEL